MMAMVVQHNMRAENSNRMLKVNTQTQAKSQEKLASGYKINRAADDAAGLSISEKMRRQIRGLKQASLNAADGISMVQTAEGALNEVHDMLQRMSELVIKGNNGTLQSEDVGYIQAEINQLASEITRTADDTTFNEKSLLNANQTIKLQVGTEAGHTITFNLSQLDATTLSVTGDKVKADKDTSIKLIKDAIQTVSTFRSELGATQNRLEHTINNLDNVAENTTAAESQIRDTDMASEMVKLSNINILAQAGTSRLAQANQGNQGILALLQ